MAPQAPAAIASRVGTRRAYGARMVSPELPAALAAGLDELVERSERTRLESAARRLSAAYRAEGGGGRVARTAEEAAAYATYRAPATYAAAAAVLGRVR